MSRLTESDRNNILAAIESQRSGLLATLKTTLAEAGDTQFAAVLGSSPGDSSDEALALSLGNLSAARVDHEIRAIQALDTAKYRLAEAGFGDCSDCGTAIPVERLLVNPAATRCTICQDRHEHTYAGQTHSSL